MSLDTISQLGGAGYGVLFCLTGKENLISEQLEKSYRHIRATAAKQIKRRSKNGVTWECEEIVFPGYVFFQCENPQVFGKHMSVDGMISLLTNQDGDWRLSGHDEAFAKWLFTYDGVIGLSKAYKEGDRIYFVEGPLKDIEGQITKIDRRNQSGQVIVNLGGRSIRIWLGFNLVERIGC